MGASFVAAALAIATALASVASAQEATARSPAERPGPSAAPVTTPAGAAHLRELERAVEALRARLDDAKARTDAIAGRAIDGAPSTASPLRIVHEDRMSSSYRLVRAVYELDGVRIFDRDLEAREVGAFDVYVGGAVPGAHRLTVALEYRGEGSGVFSYLRGYRFRVRSTYALEVEPSREGRAVRVVAHERGGPSLPLEERPAIRFELERLGSD